jgi:hypothetical protein
LIDIFQRSFTKEMEMISHKNEGMDLEPMVPHFKKKLLKHNLPNFPKRYGKKFFSIASGGYMIRMDG